MSQVISYKCLSISTLCVVSTIWNGFYVQEQSYLKRTRANIKKRKTYAKKKKNLLQDERNKAAG
jgi:hypothetical protein